MNNEDNLKNLDFNEIKQILKNTIDQADNKEEVLWTLFFLACFSFGTEKMDEILNNSIKKCPVLKKQIEKYNITLKQQ